MSQDPANLIGRTCPYCRFPLKEASEVTECAECHAVHHAECFADNQGCAIHGCLGGPASHPAAGQPAAPQPTPIAVDPEPQASPPMQPVATAAYPQQGKPPTVTMPAEEGRSHWKPAAIVIGLLFALGGAGAALAITLRSSSKPAETVTQVAATVTVPSQPDPGDGSGYTDTGDGGTNTTDGGNGGGTQTTNSSGNNGGDPGDNNDQNTNTTSSNDGGSGSDSGSSSGNPTGHVASVGHNGPKSILERHYELIDEGHPDKAFELMDPSYRASQPGWVSAHEDADSHVNIVTVGPVHYSGSDSADVDIDFYARDTYKIPGSDTQCREFVGTAHMVRIDGLWRYLPSKGYSAYVQSSSDPNCP